jgi:L-ascorbate metabolism protein UlaG (beta-lactamase superfamily)
VNARRSPARVVLGALWLSAAPAVARDMDVIYLANEGVLLRSGSQAVLVDALFGEGLDGYATVAPAERARLERAEPPYDQVTLVLATHRHRDHFDPSAVARFLAANPRAHFLSTPQAVAELRSALGAAGEPAAAGRIHASLPAAGVAERQELGGVSLRVLRLHHGTGSGIENLGFLVDLGGVRALHVGDSDNAADLAAYRLHEERIDIALLPVWFYSWADYDAAVRELGALRRVAFHVALPEAPADYHGPAASFDELRRLVEERAPGVELLSRPDQRLVVAPAAAR